MKYSDIREKVETGDLFFTAGGSLFSRFIRLFTHSIVSHVGIFVEIENRLFIIESLEGKGVVMALASTRIKKEKFWFYGKTREKVDVEKTKGKLFNALGDNYDLGGALLALFIDTKTSKRFCSELVAHCLGIKFKNMRRGILPSDLRIECRGNFHKITNS